MHRTIMTIVFGSLAAISNITATLLILLGALVTVFALTLAAQHVPLWRFGIPQYFLWIEAFCGLLIAVGAFLAGKRRLVGVLLLLTPVVSLLFDGDYLAATIWTAFVVVLFGIPLLLYKMVSLKDSDADRVA
jgi:hypothetical protein